MKLHASSLELYYKWTYSKVLLKDFGCKFQNTYPRISNTKSVLYYFFVKTNILQNFRTSISISLNYQNLLISGFELVCNPW